MLDGNAEVVVADDGSDRERVASGLRRVADTCDVVLGPYSTSLMRVAARIAPELGRVVWNHGGAGDDVQVASPGHVSSVLSPASRYCAPLLRDLATRSPGLPLCLVSGSGSFGRQVVSGAEAVAGELGIVTLRVGPSDDLTALRFPAGWDLFCAGSFEEDVVNVGAAVALDSPPRLIGAVAAGVREFGTAVPSAEGIHGIAQWFPGHHPAVDLGPAEDEFLAAYSALTGGPPDYPAVQAAAAAVLAAHCARAGRSTARTDVWAVAAELRATTVYGPFRIDPRTGAQLDHETTHVVWTADGLVPARPGAPRR